MSPQIPDAESLVEEQFIRDRNQPIAGTYVAMGCQICPLAKSCLTTADLQNGRAKQLSVGRTRERDESSPYRLPVGHPAWSESTPDQRRVRSQHAEGRFLSLKHLRRIKRLPYRGIRRNQFFLLLGGMSYNVRRAIDLRKIDMNPEQSAEAA